MDIAIRNARKKKNELIQEYKEQKNELNSKKEVIAEKTKTN